MTDQTPPAASKQLRIRLVIATSVGITVAVIAICVAWQQDLEYWLGGKQTFTRMDLMSLHKAVEAYQSETGALPSTLEDIGKPRGSESQPTAWPLVDHWGRPFIYEHNGKDFVVRSLGRDGKPGGVGLDCDLSEPRSPTQHSYPTLRQFVFEMRTGGIIASCLLGGLLGAGLTFIMVRPHNLTIHNIPLAVIKIAFTALGALVTAAIMAFHHVNWGH